MPETLFTVELADGGEKKNCYSPSSVVRDHFALGEEMTVAGFVERSRKALSEASERVRAKYGFACSSALAQLREIEHWAREYPPEAVVRVVELRALNAHPPSAARP